MSPGRRDGALSWLCLPAVRGVVWCRSDPNSVRNRFKRVRSVQFACQIGSAANSFSSVRRTGAKCLRSVRLVQFIQFSSRTLSALMSTLCHFQALWGAWPPWAPLDWPLKVMAPRPRVMPICAYLHNLRTISAHNLSKSSCKFSSAEANYIADSNKTFRNRIRGSLIDSDSESESAPLS